MPQRGLHRQFHLYKDWIYSVLLTLTGIVVLGGFYLHNQRQVHTEPETTQRSQTYDFYDNDLYKIVPPDSQYPSPSQTQLAFYRIYNPTNTVSFSLEWTERNLHRDPSIGSHVFALTITNSLNSAQNISGDALQHISVGCVAYENPYRTGKAVAFKSFTLSAYEQRRISLTIDISCLYLGTPDGKYFWRIY